MLPADIDCYGYYDSEGAAADYFNGASNDHFHPTGWKRLRKELLDASRPGYTNPSIEFRLEYRAPFAAYGQPHERPSQFAACRGSDTK